MSSPYPRSWWRVKQEFGWAGLKCGDLMGGTSPAGAALSKCIALGLSRGAPTPEKAEQKRVPWNEWVSASPRQPPRPFACATSASSLGFSRADGRALLGSLHSAELFDGLAQSSWRCRAELGP